MRPIDDTGLMFAFDPAANERHFHGEEGLLPLWVAEPYLPLAPAIVNAMTRRASTGWYGYESRPAELLSAFWDWMDRRHGWSAGGLDSTVSPSVGTSIAGLVDLYTSPGDGVILQPPVFTDFKPLVRRHGREPIRNSLILEDGRYSMDLQGLERIASEPTTTALILCNPHNPVGRAWNVAELRSLAQVCSSNGVAVISDEIHADVVLGEASFTPFAFAASKTGVRWAATHGPVKTFGLAGVADTLVVTEDEEITAGFRKLSSRLHLTRNNVFGIAAAQAGYLHGDDWLDEFISSVESNVHILEDCLPEAIRVIRPEATYLAWLDFRALGLDVPELAAWLTTEARLAISQGHWFGREGAGFARMTIAVEESVVTEAAHRLRSAVARLH